MCKVWILELGNFGFWILGILDFGFWILDFGDLGFWILDWGFWMGTLWQNFGCYIRKEDCARRTGSADFASLGYILQTAREKTNSSRGIKLLGLAAVLRKATFLAFGHSLPARKDRKNEVFKTLVNIWGVIPGGNLGNTSFKSFVLWLIIIRWNFCTFFLVASKIVLFWLQAALNVLILPIGLPHTPYYPDWKILLNVCSCIYVYQIE